MEPPIGDTAGRVQIRELDDSRLEQAVRLWESDADGDAESPFSLRRCWRGRGAAAGARRDHGRGGRRRGRGPVDGERAWVLRWAVAAVSPARRRADLLRTLERRLQALGVREISMLTAHGEAAVSAAQAAGYILQDGMRTSRSGASTRPSPTSGSRTRRELALRRALAGDRRDGAREGSSSGASSCRSPSGTRRVATAWSRPRR